MPVVPIDRIGTDPAQANVLKTRTVKVPAYLGIPAPAAAQGGVICVDAVDGPAVTEAPFAWALAVVTGRVIDRWYADHHTSPADQARMNGYRDNCVQAPDGYMARPLNGVWATAPYLHNGSVPSLDDLLAPAAERPKSFCAGNLEFDPVKVGYDPTCRTGMNRVDTTTPGNLNTGHSFQDGPRVPGAIGKRGAFSQDERMALIAYLKTL